MVLNFDPKILWTFLTVLTLILVKTLFAWIIAWVKGEFNIREAPRFIVTQVVPYAVGLFILALPSVWVEDLAAVYYVAVASVIAKYLVEIKDRFQELFGIQLPENKVQ